MQGTLGYSRHKVHAPASASPNAAQATEAVAGRRVFNYARTGVNSSERPMRTASMRTSFISPREKKKRARIGAQQIESNESSPYLRSSEDVNNNVGASVPPPHAGPGEMKARVDCGYADPPCVSAILCRCSRAEHLIDARQWVKESNLRVSPGSH